MKIVKYLFVSKHIKVWYLKWYFVIPVGAGVMFYRRQYYLKPEALEDSYSHSDCASCNYTDTEVFQTVSYGDCVGIDMAKVSFSLVKAHISVSLKH